MKISNARIFSYADDTAIIFEGNSLSRLRFIAGRGMAVIAELLRLNLLTLYTTKTNYILFCVKNTSPDFPGGLRIHNCQASFNINYLLKMFVGTSKEKFFYHNTLLSLVKALIGQNTIIDLRNDTYVCGLISSVDGFMNVSLSNVIYCDPQGNEYSFENLFLHARNIRYVHVPQTMSILSTIKNELTKGKMKPKVDKPVEKSRKAKKALKQHMETVALLGKE